MLSQWQGWGRRIGAHRRLLAVCVVLITSAAAAAPALAQTTYTWTGADASSPDWSLSDNWDSNGVPSSSLTDTSLSFPALTSTACTASTPTATCYFSTDDLGSSLSANSLTIDDGVGYQLRTADPSSDTIALGAGGLTARPSVNDLTTVSPAQIGIPITLGAAQSWSITGGDLNQQLELGAPVTGSSYTLGIALNQYTFLGLSGDNEVGDVTVTGDANPGTLVLGNVIASTTLNGSDGHGVTIDGAGLFADPGVTGALSVSGSGGVGGQVQIGEGLNNPGESLLTVDGTASLSSTASLSMYINDATGNVAGTDYSQLSASGNISLGGAALDLSDYNGGCPTLTVGQVYTLVQTTGGTLSGTFAGLPGGSGSDLTLNCSPGTAPTLEIDYTSTSATATVVTAGSGGTSSTTTLASTPSNPVTNQTVTLTATVSPAASSPSGTVEFYDGSNPITGCTSQPVTASGPTYTATCTTSFSAASSPESLTAMFTPSSGSSLTGSTSSPDMLTVGLDSTATALQASSTTPHVGQSVTYTASVSPGQTGPASPTGTVAFLDSGAPIGGCGAQPISAGVATCTVTYTSAGTHTVSAQYSGNTGFQSSRSPTVSVIASATSTSGATGPGVGRAGPARVAGKTLADLLSCSGSSSQKCGFRLTLTVIETLRGSRLVGVAARADRTKVRKRTVTLASKTVTLSAGKNRTLKLNLNGTGIALLKRRGSLPVSFTVKQGTRTVRKQTVTFRKTKKKT